MLRIMSTGYDGKMGKIVADTVRADESCELAFTQAREAAICAQDVKIYENLADCNEKADAIIDFSHHANLDNVLGYALRTKTPIVIATTGFNDEELQTIKDASKEIPVFFSYNMSLGVNILVKLVKEAAKLLDGFDIEIIEKHHNRKVDAPSGTAIMIANAVKEVLPESNFVNGRSGRSCKRQPGDIGISAVRGGTIVGEHDALFAGDSETITISHQAQSRQIFANGALAAAKFIADKEPGFYNMDDMLNR
ncbi:4-hydroxy-tetrahydrodipicolinate reductase [Peptacetobacter hominis]|uniref:4-hydroxy-tetrahydrodipicolinate reductase n=1 Tax=Peptacetobacter hominis TaxID=2743610 RepID=A0A544QXZ5_9FIRM|nr:4-hydroxy-tetrahydrodipicolinate reductase [Peptacetobacter hominis]TQQ85505.1 4-hydroxy-tetrahydrodipicolinate reductase [Peptacetobacter hominis]